MSNIASGRLPSKNSVASAHSHQGRSHSKERALLERRELQGYHGPGATYPRKYIKASLKAAYNHGLGTKPPDVEYKNACKALGATPNSGIKERLHYTGGEALRISERLHYTGGEALRISATEMLGGEHVSLRDTYLGERGFLALLPILDRNNPHWTSLDASNNGLRNEAVLHLVDMLMRPNHMSRSIHLNLSRNPGISEGAGRALVELVQVHPHIESVDVRFTKMSRRLAVQLREVLAERKQKRGQEAKVSAVAVEEAAAAVPAGEPSPSQPPPAEEPLAGEPAPGPAPEELAAAEPAAAEPAAAEPAATEPVSAELAAPGAAAAEPAPADPAAAEAAPAEPVAVEPAAVEPAPAEPVVAEPVAAEPAPAEPAHVEPSGADTAAVVGELPVAGEAAVAAAEGAPS